MRPARLLLGLMLLVQPAQASVVGVAPVPSAPAPAAGQAGAALSAPGASLGLASPGLGSSLPMGLPGPSLALPSPVRPSIAPSGAPATAAAPAAPAAPAAVPASAAPGPSSPLPAASKSSPDSLPYAASPASPATVASPAPAAAPRTGAPRTAGALRAPLRENAFLKAALSPVSGGLKDAGRLGASGAKAEAQADWDRRLGAGVAALPEAGVEARGAGVSGRSAGTPGQALLPGERPLGIVMASAEAVPFVKTGGLADVVDDVSRGLAARGHRVSLLLPKYGTIDEKTHGLDRVPGAFAVPLDGRVETARLWRMRRDGVDVYFVENERLFGRKGIYAEGGRDYGDNDERFVFFSRAVLEAARFLDLRPDIIHAHDWHAALIAPMLKLQLKGKDPYFDGTRTVLTVHNLAYQGVFGPQALLKAGFSMADFTYDRLMHREAFNFLKAGLQYADALTTVSPTYALQILTREFGEGLEGLLQYRKESLHGILNAIDPALYDPASGGGIARSYGIDDAAAGKADNKLALQKRLGLRQDASAPLFTVAARLASQKGLDLVVEAASEIVRRGGQLLVTGSGDPELERRFDELARRYPGSVHRHPFDTELIRQVYAGGDFLLMPSRFEPCGLSQLFAQRYGNLPIVSRTGGLADTVTDARRDPARGDGLFLDELSAGGLASAVEAAFSLYADPGALARTRRAAMSKDFSWKRSIEKYVGLFLSLLRG